MEFYQVKAGDTLSIIARDVLGDVAAWPKLAQLNNIVAPYTIFPGMQLIMPADILGPVVVPAGDMGPPAPTRAPRPAAAGPDIADIIAGVNPYVWYAAAAVLLFVLLDRK